MGKKQTIVHKRSIVAKNVSEKKKPDNANIYNIITYEAQLYRVNQNIQELRDAITAAESIQFPQRYQLYRTYSDAILDTHLSGCIANYKNLVLSREFNFYKKDGEINEETSKLLKTKWFRDFCSLALDSIFWGHSLIQMGDVTKDGFSSVQLIPRIYVKPEFHITTETYTAITGTDYREEPYKWWVVPVGDDKDLGLLMKASFHAIWKKTALGAWAQYAQIFGTPTRVLKSAAKDVPTMRTQEKMMKNFGANQWAILDPRDDFQYLEAKRTDAYQIFKELVNTGNEEISKLILGGTGTMEDKSHVGAAETHERAQDRIKHSATFFIENIIEKQLKPILIYHGFPISDEVCKVTDNTDVEIKNKIQIDIELIKSAQYKLSAEYIKTTYGSDVEEVDLPEDPKEKEAKPKAIKNALDELYQ